MDSSKSAAALPTTNTAYFYSETFWARHELHWIKTLLLFFDDISILLPSYMYGRHTVEDPFVAGPLEERGLLKILDPKVFITQEMAEDLATVVVDLLTTGAFDNLNTDGSTHFHELSRTRLGWGVDIDLSDWLVSELKGKGLARDSEDGVSVPLHPSVRRLILFLLSQIARRHGGDGHTTFHPVSSQFQVAQDLISVLSSEPMPSAGHVVALDTEHVAIDLESVPLDDILAFRAEHGAEYRAYTRDLRRFTAELGKISDPKLRLEALADRQSELADRATELRKSAMRRWLRPTGKIGLGLAGAAWNLSTGDPVGAFINVGQAVLEAPDAPSVEAYSYVVQVERSLSRSA